MKSTSKDSADWFKLKRYPHIGLPIKFDQISKIRSYITNPEKIRKHSFLPFLHRAKKQRKFRPRFNEEFERSNLRFPDVKKRDLYYASHVDANIFSYYASLLQANYEKRLREASLTRTVTAYRKVPSGDGERNSNNVDFALEVFKFIDNRNQDMSVICIDITKFFDNLDHSYLKKAWSVNMSFGASMPDDHYSVFKAITQFRFVSEDDIYTLFKDDLVVGVTSDEVKKRAVSSRGYMRSKNVIAYCEKENLSKIVDAGIIRPNNKEKFETKSKGRLVVREKGIPQGSAISAMLANIYFYDVDCLLSKEISKIGGLYRRYSDDLIFVVPSKYEASTKSLVEHAVRDAKLEIQPAKTEVYLCEHLGGITNVSNPANPKIGFVKYLGLEYSGKKVYLTSQSLAKYYRKMKRSVRRGFYYSGVINNDTNGELFKRRLYKKFTHKGAGRRKRYKQVKNGKTHKLVGTSYDWGNYHTYTKMAHSVIEKSGLKSGIAHQMSKSWNKFHELF
jgi:hypothetical protein